MKDHDQERFAKLMEDGIFVKLGSVGQIEAIGISHNPNAGGPRVQRMQSWAFVAPKRTQIDPVYFPNGEQTLIFVACCATDSRVAAGSILVEIVHVFKSGWWAKLHSETPALRAVVSLLRDKTEARDLLASVAEMPLSVYEGDTIFIHGLNRTELNGCKATVKGVMEDVYRSPPRVICVVKGETMRIKVENLCRSLDGADKSAASCDELVKRFARLQAMNKEDPSDVEAGVPGAWVRIDELDEGLIVKIDGLVQRRDLNGKEGVVVYPYAFGGRVPCIVDGK